MLDIEAKDVARAAVIIAVIAVNSHFSKLPISEQALIWLAEVLSVAWGAS